MWDAVRKMFGHDERSHDATAAGSSSGAPGAPRSQDPRTAATMPSGMIPSAATPDQPGQPGLNPTIANTVPLSSNDGEGHGPGNAGPAPMGTAGVVGGVSGTSGAPTAPLSLSDRPIGGQEHDGIDLAPASPQPAPAGTNTPPSTLASTSDGPAAVGAVPTSPGSDPVADVESDASAPRRRTARRRRRSL